MKREACHGPTDHLRRHRGRIEEARDQARGVPGAQDAAVPWAELVAAVEPFYYPGKRGRRPIGVERMLRMYFLQLWFGLSDEGVEDAIYDSRAFSRFMGVGFGRRRPGPRRHHAAEVPPDDRGAELPPCPLPKRCQKSARGLARREKRGSRGQRSRNTIRTPKDIKPIHRTFTLNL